MQSVVGCGTRQRGLECFAYGVEVFWLGKLGPELEAWIVGLVGLLSSLLIIKVTIRVSILRSSFKLLNSATETVDC